MENWCDLSALQAGTARQQAAERVLLRLNVFGRLRRYSPLLAGTIRLDVDVPSSDLDVICKVDDLAAFEREVHAHFGTEANFRIKRRVIHGLESVIANFDADQFTVEIFGQSRLIEAQNAYRHMVVEARLLEIGGVAARDAVRALKRSGLKTEPAFAAYFRIKGDPYQALLDLYPLSVVELRARLEGQSRD